MPSHSDFKIFLVCECVRIAEEFVDLPDFVAWRARGYFLILVQSLMLPEERGLLGLAARMAYSFFFTPLCLID